MKQIGKVPKGATSVDVLQLFKEVLDTAVQADRAALDAKRDESSSQESKRLTARCVARLLLAASLGEADTVLILLVAALDSAIEYLTPKLEDATKGAFLAPCPCEAHSVDRARDIR